MLEITRFQTRRRVRGIAGLSIAILLLSAFYIAVWPSFDAVDLEALFEQMPPFFRDMFGIIALNTIEGFLAAELYQFVWSLLLPLYFAYLAAGIVAGDFERDRLDITLSLPVTRTRLLLEEFLALVVPVVVINVVIALGILIGVIAIGETIDLTFLTLVHLLSIPYFLVVVALGLVLSVWFNRADIAQRLAIGIVFALWLVESVSRTVDREWLGGLAPSRYYDPSDILVDEAVSVVDLGVLLGMIAVLLVVAIVLFRRKDLAA